MAKKKKHTGGSNVEPNMTPMIDCTFQLIIFFILTAQMASDDLAKLAVHKPVHSMAKGEELNEIRNKVTVNIVNEYGDEKDGRDPGRSWRAKRYQVGTIKNIEAGDVEKLAEILTHRKTAADKAGHKEFFVEIRADMDIAFEDIKPVMEAAAEAKIGKMNITALVDPNVIVK